MSTHVRSSILFTGLTGNVCYGGVNYDTLSSLLERQILIDG